MLPVFLDAHDDSLVDGGVHPASAVWTAHPWLTAVTLHGSVVSHKMGEVEPTSEMGGED